MDGFNTQVTGGGSESYSIQFETDNRDHYLAVQAVCRECVDGAMPQKLILDACCGGRMFWFDHHEPHTVYVDNREMERRVIWTSKDGQETREFEVHPDIVADFRDLPFPDNTFYHVVFDPPHLTWAGETSWLAQKYGRLDDNWRDTIGRGFRECMRVLKPYGTLIFKWNETNITVREIIKVCGVEPLYGHRSGKGGKTHWLAFMKFPGGGDGDA